MRLTITTADKMRGRSLGLLSDYDDREWLWDVHLKGLRDELRALEYEDFESFVMCGFHEDSPDFIYLFDDEDPHYQATCLELDLRDLTPEELAHDQRITNGTAQPEAAAENPGLAPGAGDPS